ESTDEAPVESDEVAAEQDNVGTEFADPLEGAPQQARMGQRPGVEVGGEGDAQLARQARPAIEHDFMLRRLDVALQPKSMGDRRRPPANEDDLRDRLVAESNCLERVSKDDRALTAALHGLASYLVQRSARNSEDSTDGGTGRAAGRVDSEKQPAIRFRESTA